MISDLRNFPLQTTTQRAKGAFLLAFYLIEVRFKSTDFPMDKHAEQAKNERIFRGSP